MIVTSFSQISQEEQRSWLNKPYAIDIESEGLKYMRDDLIGVALYVNDKAYYFVRKHTAEDGQTIVNYLSDDDLRLLLTPVMSQQKQLSFLHNSKFDLHFFARFGLPLLSLNFDTLCAAQLLDENRRNGLKELTTLVDEQHTKYENLTEYGTFPKGSPLNVPLKPFAEYAKQDVVVTFKLAQLFTKQMAKDSFKGVTIQDVFTKVWMPLVPVLQEMEAIGFKVNVEKAKQLFGEYETIAEANKLIVQRAGYEMLSKRKIEDIAKLYWKIIPDEELEDIYFNDEGRPCIDILDIQTPIMQPTPKSKFRKLYFNVGSNPQLVDLILHDLKLPDYVTLPLTQSGKESVNVQNIEIIKFYLKEKTPQYIQALLDWRKASKFTTTYLNAFINETDENGRLHCFFSMAQNDLGAGGTRTGRLSSSNINLQNIPSRGDIGDVARALFVAHEGNVLVVADYENMETVIAAHFSKDPMLLKAFSEGLDVHALTASGTWNIPYDKFVEEYKAKNPEYDRMRRVAKVLVFGQAYGMGAIKLQRTLLVDAGQEFTVQECRDMISAFNSTYQGLTDYKKSVMEFARKNGFVPTILGRKRRLPNASSHDRELASRAQRQAFNALIQGSCADIMYQAMVPIQAGLKAIGGSLVASVHDELVAEVPFEFAQAACTIIERGMVDLINPKLECKLHAEAHYGINWLDAKKG